MHTKRAVIRAILRVQLRKGIIPCSLGTGKQLIVSGQGPGPEHALYIHKESAHAQLRVGVGKIILLESRRYAHVSGSFVAGLESPEENSERPGHRLGLRSETPLRTI